MYSHFQNSFLHLVKAQTHVTKKKESFLLLQFLLNQMFATSVLGYFPVWCNYMVSDWLTGRAILKTKNVEPGEINQINGASIPGEVRTFTSADTVENEDDNALG